ncbi:MAG TPA: diaminopimelate epimerase [Planctomycetota bacterium]|nr:diaminopimelate epimerase [Planctomycetota bacterium]
MRFTKMHGAGNDYVYVDLFAEKVDDPASLARAVSDRHTGIGSDGLILIAPSKTADFRMIMFNADGSEGEMCGNGIRCIGKYVFDHGLTKSTDVTVETKAGTVALQLHTADGRVERVTVDMGRPRPVPKTFHAKADGQSNLLKAACEGLSGYVVSMGNPHFVIPVESTERAPVTTTGPKIETHPDFPSRVNVEFVEVLSKTHVKQRTWERGSGETFACGSGACAVGYALSSAGLTERRTRIDLLGGTLEIEVADDGRVFMTGPAVEVFRGDFPTNAVRGR